jgi:hypothetical protein
LEISVQKKHRAISTFLIVGISLIFSLAEAHSDYSAIVEADFLTLELKFEAGDIDDLLVEKQINWDFIPSESLEISTLETDLPGFLIIFSFQIVSIDPPFSVLRC